MDEKVRIIRSPVSERRVPGGRLVIGDNIFLDAMAREKAKIAEEVFSSREQVLVSICEFRF